MEDYAQALNIAVPFFLLLIVIEALAARRMGMKINRGADAISSLSSGITNVVKDILGLSLVIISYSWLVKHVAIFEIKTTWVVFVVAFIAKDFAGYWIHRLEHEINFLWNRHVIHHSSEEFNLSCALRQSASSALSFVAIFMLPAALVGVPGEVIAVVAPIHLFAQFWYHTRLINKMGFLETFLVTPSHHRVHHGMNKEYMDKNYGQILIIWDKMFGTFQPELASAPPVYGVSRPARTWNPLLINFKHFWLLLQDAWHTRSWVDKLRLWFMPTGWRPADVAAERPVPSVQNVYEYEKYDSNPSRAMLGWSWFQLALTLGLMFFMFQNIAKIEFSGLLLYAGFLFLNVFSYTTLLDRSKFALPVEVAKAAFGFSLLWMNGWDWFGMETTLPGGSVFMMAYLVVSLGVTAWFSQKECVPDAQLA